MQVTLMNNQSIFTQILPDKQKGQYWVTQINDQGDEERIISVEGLDNRWVLKSNRTAVLLDEQDSTRREMALEPHRFYRLAMRKTKEQAWLYTEPHSPDRFIFNKVLLPEEGKITAGRSDQNAICYANPYISSLHAELAISGGQVVMQDLNSSNGTYVNGRRIQRKTLQPGDVVTILGLKMIIGNGFLAINNPDGHVDWNPAILPPMPMQRPRPGEEDEDMDEEGTAVCLFYRSPRFKRDIQPTDMRIDPPPAMAKHEPTPLILMLGPSITIGMAALFMGMFALQNAIRSTGSIAQALPTLVMSGSMVTGSVLWPILSRKFEKKKREQQEKLRTEKYQAYMAKIREDIQAEIRLQSEIMHENLVSADQCADRIRKRQRNLWERMRGQNDFLRLRLGIGDLPLNGKVQFPERKFSLEDDELLDELEAMDEEPKILERVPVTLSLEEDWITGLIGSRNSVVDLVKGLILQLVALHSYDEIKLAFIYDEKERDIWEFVKWLPHVWHQEAGVRLIASSLHEVKELSSFLDKELKNRTSSGNEAGLGAPPYYVIFAMSQTLAAKAEVLNGIYEEKRNCGFSIVHLYDELRHLPKDCSLVVEIGRNLSKIFDRDDVSGKFTAFQPDFYMKNNERELAVNLANLRLDTGDSDYSLPVMLTFLELYEVGKVEHLNAITRWRENDPTITLEAAIGVDPSGEVFKLDLHEKFHGPHGLVAGMTGSGKSEFIMTYILSLAVNYHPDEVAFILIDYKGGGMANAFAKLPHLAGTITNLDGAAVNRSLISIQSELKRRQAIFGDTGKKLSMSNIDIYKYQKLYRDGLVTEPLQHLFIISDEFAELKTQQPEFMEQLISAARIGRSLGVHLILATQKPSGVVDDQIWSNSRFRVCLKVQEKADSMDMIKRPDAAELSVTGRYYVQVGFNELFELGQSAWAGAPYKPVDRVEKAKYENVCVIDNMGRPLKEVKLDRGGGVRSDTKQIDEVVNYLANIAAEEHISVKPLWLEPIPAKIFLDQLKVKYALPDAEAFALNPLIGEYDDPVNQMQHSLHFPVQEGNTIIYGVAGSGKAMFLTTMLYALFQDHTPEEVHAYILDFDAETMRLFAKAPHVGDVLLSHDEEKIQNLFKFLAEEMETRKKRLSDVGTDFQSFVKTGNGMPAIVVVIHNYSGFSETYDGMEEAVAHLTREGLKYGIYFVVTAANSGAIRYRIQQNFKQLFVLQMNDESDYSSLLGSVGGVYPSKHAGRGIFKTDQVYEFQVAEPDSVEGQSHAMIRTFCEEYASEWKKPAAKRVPILPEIIDLHVLQSEIGRQEATVPVGVEKSSLQTATVNFNKHVIHMIVYRDAEFADFIEGLAEVLVAKGETSLTILDATGELKDIAADNKPSRISGKKQLEEAVGRCFDLMVERNNRYKEALEQDQQPPRFDKCTYMIHSLASLRSVMSADGREKLNLILEKGDVAYNVHFIVSDMVSEVSGYAHESWYKQNVQTTEGIWLGNGFGDQYQLKASKMTTELYQEIGEQFGYIVSNGKATLFKRLTATAREWEAERVG